MTSKSVKTVQDKANEPSLKVGPIIIMNLHGTPRYYLGNSIMETLTAVNTVAIYVGKPRSEVPPRKHLILYYKILASEQPVMDLFKIRDSISMDIAEQRIKEAAGILPR
ncbi:hypothetical protein COR50_13985 [Chitinophaga caeni]|uniref:Uncharacterized protein n=1 Tax=Chitinophaga caeni TaxID=2029983 RepID=A0A291QWC0_9BACT|nr:hypothetical protein [Chitinophaga caeni]ATL48182.1 hypothetical protein COR50_13985 [Chitinophaga caeni]